MRCPGPGVGFGPFARKEAPPDRLARRFLHPLYAAGWSRMPKKAGIVSLRLVQEAADDVAVSLNSIRNQLKQIFSKINTGRQSELVWLVLSSATASEAAESSHLPFLGNRIPHNRLVEWGRKANQTKTGGGCYGLVLVSSAAARTDLLMHRNGLAIGKNQTKVVFAEAGRNALKHRENSHVMPILA